MIKLRPYTFDDANKILSWIADEESFFLWCADRFKNYPLSPDDFNKQLYTDNNLYKGFVAVDENEVIGHLFIQHLQNDRYKFGLIIVDSSKRGKGYGKKMLIEALKFAKKEYGAKEVTLSVFDTNISAYNCYISLGFKKSGNYVWHNILGKEHKYIELEYKF